LTLYLAKKLGHPVPRMAEFSSDEAPVWLHVLVSILLLTVIKGLAQKLYQQCKASK
jgi:hypothetical protein